MNNYSNTLINLREEKGLTQIEMAKILKIDHSQYSHYELQDRVIPIKHLVAICDFFDVSIDYIFDFTKDKKYNTKYCKVNKDKAGKRLKEFRVENNLTQSVLAGDLGTVHTTIIHYEQGRNLISTPFLYSICQTYGISADYLLGRIDKPKYIKIKEEVKKG